MSWEGQGAVEYLKIEQLRQPSHASPHRFGSRKQTAAGSKAVVRHGRGVGPTGFEKVASGGVSGLNELSDGLTKQAGKFFNSHQPATSKQPNDMTRSAQSIQVGLEARRAWEGQVSSKLGVPAGGPHGGETMPSDDRMPRQPPIPPSAPRFITQSTKRHKTDAMGLQMAPTTLGFPEKR